MIVLYYHTILKKNILEKGKGRVKLLLRAEDMETNVIIGRKREDEYKSKRVTVQVSEVEKRRIEELARHYEVTPSVLIRQWLKKEYLKVFGEV